MPQNIVVQITFPECYQPFGFIDQACSIPHCLQLTGACKWVSDNLGSGLLVLRTHFAKTVSKYSRRTITTEEIRQQLRQINIHTFITRNKWDWQHSMRVNLYQHMYMYVWNCDPLSLFPIPFCPVHLSPSSLPPSLTQNEGWSLHCVWLLKFWTRDVLCVQWSIRRHIQWDTIGEKELVFQMAEEQTGSFEQDWDRVPFWCEWDVDVHVRQFGCQILSFSWCLMSGQIILLKT